jgi:hypothetical protein
VNKTIKKAGCRGRFSNFFGYGFIENQRILSTNLITTRLNLKVNMIQRRLFSNEALIDEFTAGLTKIESDGWTTKYFNNSTGEYWLKYINEIHRGLTTWSTHLMILSPRPTTSELIDIALLSPFPDEVIAAATRLYLDEQERQMEFRGDLIDKLAKIDIDHISTIERNRIRNIIQHASLLHAINIRPIVGKHYTEIQADAEFFALTSRRARELLENLPE